MVFVTFALTLPAIAMPTRGWLKLSGYFIVINAIYSVVLGLYLWILTLQTKERFSPVWNIQTSQVQDLMQTSVRVALPKPAFDFYALDEENGGIRLHDTSKTHSSPAVASSTAPLPPSSRTRRVHPRPLPP